MVTLRSAKGYREILHTNSDDEIAYNTDFVGKQRSLQESHRSAMALQHMVRHRCRDGHMNVWRDKNRQLPAM
jgi:hypothetical protein